MEEAVGARGPLKAAKEREKRQHHQSTQQSIHSIKRKRQKVVFSFHWIGIDLLMLIEERNDKLL